MELGAAALLLHEEVPGVWLQTWDRAGEQNPAPAAPVPPGVLPLPALGLVSARGRARSTAPGCSCY